MPIPNATYRETPISFEKGQISSYESSVIPDGSAAEILNWVPEESGGLRCRPGWSMSSTTSAPSPAVGAGVGVFSRPTRAYVLQSVAAHGTTTNGTTHDITATWDRTTTSGDLLVAVMNYRINSTTTGRVGTAVPAYWSLIDSTAYNISSTYPSDAVWMVGDASPQSGAQTWTIHTAASTQISWDLILMEIVHAQSGVTAGANLLPAHWTSFEWPWSANNTTTAVAPVGWQTSTPTQFNWGSSTSYTSHGYLSLWINSLLSGTAEFGTLTGTSGIPVSAGTQYTASAWGRAQSTGMTISIKWYNAAGTYLSATTGSTITDTPAWGTATGTAPANAAFAEVHFSFVTTSSVYDAWLDAVQLEVGGSRTTFAYKDRPTAMENDTFVHETTDPFTSTTTAVLTSPCQLAVGTFALFDSSYTTSQVTAYDTGWTEVEGVMDAGLSDAQWLSVATKVQTSVAAFSLNATVSGSPEGSVRMYTFKTVGWTGSDRWIFAGQANASTIGIYYIDSNDLTSGTWTLLETLSVSPGDDPVAFASGLGVLMYTHPSMSYPRYWGGLGTSPTDATETYPGQAIAFHKSRFFVGGAFQDPSTLFYSDIGSYTSWAAANYMDIGKGDGEPIRDIASQENLLVIAKDTGIWTLSGSGPDTFYLNKLPYGNAAPGRSICVTPYGTVVAGTTAVWGIVSASVESLSKALGPEYAPAGEVSTAFIDGKLYILDVVTGTIFVQDMESQAWHKEEINNANYVPKQLYSLVNRLFATPTNATTTGLLMYRQEPASTRAITSPDIATFSVSSAEMWPVGPRSKCTPRHLFIQLRQRDADATALSVKIYYDGVLTHTKSIGAHSAVCTKRERLDLGGKLGCSSFQIVIEGASNSTDELYDIESVVLGFEEEQIR